MKYPNNEFDCVYHTESFFDPIRDLQFVHQCWIKMWANMSIPLHIRIKENPMQIDPIYKLEI